MPEQAQFFLKDHGDKLLELVINTPDLKIGSKAVETLKMLSKRVTHLILTLSPGSSINPELEKTILECGELGVLKIVLEEKSQIPFDLKNIRYFSNIADAKIRIKGEKSLDRILGQMSSISTLKTTIYKLIEMLQDPDIPFSEIEKVAESDPNLVLRMLETANSAFNMRRNRIESLNMAVTYLGIEGIRQILANEMFRGFVSFYRDQHDKLIHMRRTSHLAAFLGQQIGLDAPTISKIKISGLLHDIGSLGLSFFNKADFIKVTNKVRNEKIDSSEAELHVFGIEHQEVGERFALEIGLPDYIRKVISSHHKTFGAEDDVILATVASANGFLNEKIEKINFSEYNHLLDNLAEQKIEFDKKQLEKNPSKKPDENAEHFETNFTAAQFDGLLKECLDDLIASGEAS